jgi:hypothetical protein
MGAGAKTTPTGWSVRVAAFGERLALYSSNHDEMLDALSAAFDGPRPDASLLSDTEAALLDEVGVGAPGDSSLQRQAFAGSFAALVATSVTVDQLANAIAVTASRIRQRLNHDRTLWGFKTGPRHQWRIPAWEILDGQLLPGIEELAKAIPTGLHPVAVDRLVHTPNPDLDIDGEPASALDWLAAGNDPTAAAAAIGDPTSVA